MNEPATPDPAPTPPEPEVGPPPEPPPSELLSRSDSPVFTLGREMVDRVRWTFAELAGDRTWRYSYLASAVCLTLAEKLTTIGERFAAVGTRIDDLQDATRTAVGGLQGEAIKQATRVDALAARVERIECGLT